eukprot:3092061-Rhodomonas_salina.1
MHTHCPCRAQHWIFSTLIFALCPRKFERNVWTGGVRPWVSCLPPLSAVAMALQMDGFSATIITVTILPPPYSPPLARDSEIFGSCNRSR